MPHVGLRVRLAAMASAMHLTSVKQMALLLGVPLPTAGHPLSLKKLEKAFLKQAIPKRPIALGAVLLTNLDTKFNPGHVTLSWIDPGALSFARALSFEVIYFANVENGEVLWQAPINASPGPLQRMATTLDELQGPIGDSDGLLRLFLSVQGFNDFGTGPTKIQSIDF